MNIEGFYFYRVANVNVKIKKTSTNKKRSNLFFLLFMTCNKMKFTRNMSQQKSLTMQTKKVPNFHHI